MKTLLSAFLLFCVAIVAPLRTTAAETNSSPARLDRNQLLVYRDGHGLPRPVKSVRDWEKRRAEIVRGMESVMGPLPGREKRCALEVKSKRKLTAAPMCADRLHTPLNRGRAYRRCC